MNLLRAQQERIQHWYPALLGALVAGSAFATYGQTPLLRAMAMAIVIAGVTLSLRRLGPIYAIASGLLLAFSPVYWSQTGGPPTVSGWLIITFIVAGGGLALALLAISKRLFVSVVVGLVTFVGLYLIFGITQKSLRLTSILAAWLLYLTIVALRQTNPRPDDPPAKPLSQRHTYGVLLMLTLGILNDPLMVLYAPAITLGLWLARARLAAWQWVLMGGLMLFGSWRMWEVYVSLDWLMRSTVAVAATDQTVPYIVLGGWRDPQRWLALTGFMRQQFGLLGILLGAVGIARMARWYPTLGLVLILAYSSYGIFGLVYFGPDAELLLLPMVMIQVICITYAVYSMVGWLWRSLPTEKTMIFGRHPQSNV